MNMANPAVTPVSSRAIGSTAVRQPVRRGDPGSTVLHPVPVQGPRPVGQPIGEETDVLRSVTFYMGMALIFVKFAMLHEIQTAVMGFNGRLLYVFGIPAALGVLLSGGLGRGMAGRPAYYWVAFSAWMCLATPFSFWRGKSLYACLHFIGINLILLFVIAGLVVSWRECRLLMRFLALATMVNLLSSRIFSSEAGGRLDLEFGTVSNANDFAAHLLLVLPFLLLVVYRAKSIVVRSGALLAICYGCVVIARTASRGALIGMIAGVLFLIVRGSNRQRIALACIVPLTVLAIMTVVPGTILQRLRSFSATETDVSEEALESSASRQYLLKKAIEYAIHNPLVGVGPAVFSDYEGSHNQVIGTHGMYHNAHNSYVLAFAEMGVPGGIFMLGAYLSSFLLLNRTYRKAKLRKECLDIQQTVLCVMLGMCCFYVAITFVNFTYMFYGPALGGLAISISRAADQEFARRVPIPA